MTAFSARVPRATFPVAAAVAAALFTAPAALAADAPTRVVDINEAGQRAGGSVAAVAAVAPGAKEVILRLSESTAPGSPTYIAVRDVAAGKTTKLFSSSTRLELASDDTQRLLVTTEAGLTPADTNGKADVYVYDRPSGESILVSRTASGAATGDGWDVASTLSGDGKVVFLGTSTGPIRRVTVDTGAVTELPTRKSSQLSTDRTGSVVLASGGIVKNGAVVPNPGNVDLASLTAPVFADNGGTLVALIGNLGAGSLRVTDTATGASRVVPLPSWVQREYPALVDVNADGSKALLAISLNRGGSIGTRLVLGTVDLTTGAVAQVGGDLPWNGNRGAAVTPDWAFAGAAGVVAQLGTTPIPGSDAVPVPVDPRPALEYTPLSLGCRANYSVWPFVPARRPSLYLAAGPVGRSPQVPAKADFVVKKTSTGVITNQFTLAPGTRRELTTGYGDFTYTAKVTFKDGSSVTGSNSVPSYTAPICTSSGAW